jgi:hypothetical protein
MKKLSSSIPTRSGEHPIELRSIATVAAAFATCAHPTICHVPATVSLAGEAVGAIWCAACGALGAEEGPTLTWQPPTLTSLLGRAQFETLSTLLQRVRVLRDLAGTVTAASRDAVLREVLGALSELARTPLVRDADRLDDAIARMPPADPSSTS